MRLKEDIKALPSEGEHHRVYDLPGYIKRTYPRPVRTLPFGVLDLETYSLEDGRQRAYRLEYDIPR